MFQRSSLEIPLTIISPLLVRSVIRIKFGFDLKMILRVKVIVLPFGLSKRESFFFSFRTWWSMINVKVFLKHFFKTFLRMCNFLVLINFVFFLKLINLKGSKSLLGYIWLNVSLKVIRAKGSSMNLSLRTFSIARQQIIAPSAFLMWSYSSTARQSSGWIGSRTSSSTSSTSIPSPSRLPTEKAKDSRIINSLVSLIFSFPSRSDSN